MDLKITVGGLEGGRSNYLGYQLMLYVKLKFWLVHYEQLVKNSQGIPFRGK